MPIPTLESLPQPSLHQLAHLLQTLPHEHGLSYSERVSSTLLTLPTSLKHKSRLSLSSLLSPTTAFPPIKSRLCLLHASLSGPLIHQIFTLLSLEIGINSNSLMAHNTWLTPKQHVALQRLRELHSLWLPEQAYRSVFLAAPNRRWPYQKSGCEGCILSRIGSDLQIVAGLRTLLLSRRRTAKPREGHPRLLGFVDGWVRGLLGSGERCREVMRGSEMEGEELKIVRKRIWRERRERRRLAKGKGKEVERKEKEKESEKEEEQIGQETFDSDFENEIIDHYAALRSTLHLPSVKASPAQVPSLTTGTSAQTLSSRIEFSDMPHPERSQYPQTSSVYSAHQSNAAPTYVPPRRGEAWRGQASADKEAAQYRNLLTPLPEQPLSRSKSVQNPDKRREPSHRRNLLTPPPEEPLPLRRSNTVKREEPKRQTTWSQFSRSLDYDYQVAAEQGGKICRLFLST